jgi:signal transduction histidine kinase
MRVALREQSWDLVIADYSMPQFTALEALEILKETNLDVPFIVVSGSIGEETAVAAMKAGAHDYLLKGNLTRLGATVARELREVNVRGERKWAVDALALLSDCGLVLHGWADDDATLPKIAQRVVPFLADWCLVEVFEKDGALREVVGAHTDPALVGAVEELGKRYPHSPRATALAHVEARIEKGELLADVTESALRQLVEDPSHAALLRRIGIDSFMILPLWARGRHLGVMSFGSAKPRAAFRTRDFDVAEQLVRRVALALDNARLYRDAQAAIQLREDFLSVASHELKTPLTPLELQLHTLESKVAEYSRTEKREWLETRLSMIRRQGDRLSRLVNDLLDVSRIVTGRLRFAFEPVDLCALVGEITDNFKVDDQLQGHGSTSALELEMCGAIVGQWDRIRLEQVVMNILSNAMKYGEGKPIRIVVETDGDTAVLAVSDRGIGIAPKDQQRIFDRFERAVSVNHYGGLGLGLFIAKQLVEAMGGTIGVESTEGRGATFTVKLPLNGGTTEVAVKE